MHIVITGNIGVGKSTVLNLIKKYLPEVPFYSVDDYVASLYQNPKIIQKLENKFGTSNKKELSTIFFTDKNKKKEIENIFNPLIEEFLISNKENNKNTITEFPVVFEYNYTFMFDKVILIVSDDTLRIQRVKVRNNHSEEKIKEIFANQIPQEQKINKSDFIIENNSTLEELEKQIKSLISIKIRPILDV